MIYECEKCAATLPPCVLACPVCGDVFDEPVPSDAAFPPLNDLPLPIATSPPARPATAFRKSWPLTLLIVLGGYSAAVVRNVYVSQNPQGTASDLHVVTYIVTGTASTVDLAYRDASGNRTLYYAVPLPWSRTLRMTSGTFMYLSAQNRAEDGNVVTEIDVDGTPHDKSSDQGAFAISLVDDSL